MPAVEEQATQGYGVSLRAPLTGPANGEEKQHGAWKTKTASRGQGRRSLRILYPFFRFFFTFCSDDSISFVSFPSVHLHEGIHVALGHFELSFCVMKYCVESQRSHDQRGG